MLERELLKFMWYGGDNKEEKGRTNPGDEDLQGGEMALQEQQMGKEELMEDGNESHRENWTEEEISP
jgi:hypothetical protein